MNQKGYLLLVEDDEDLRETLREELSDLCHVETAHNGLEAVELIKSKHYDAILSDVKMPKMSGLELLKWLRENNYRSPFILLTGFGTSKLAMEALQLGAYNFLDKPPKEQELCQAVEKAIEIGMLIKFWNQAELQEISISNLIKESSDKAKVTLAKALGLPQDHLMQLKAALLKKY